ncbi:Protein HYPER-SENSITIVITY-RELATED 4 [Linum grandiflorum]
MTRFSSQLTMVVDEYNGIESNQIYHSAEIYLAGKVNSSTLQRLNVSKVDKENQIQVRMENKTLKLSTVHPENLYGNMSEAWNGINLDHPATFDTLAMDAEVKNMVLTDLDRFLKRKDYYRKVGKAWKRGYLLYGPPGTGKSSLIAAMANYLHFDIYDLELTQLSRDAELRRLLIATPNRSILVVEDIDCTIDQNQERVSLSGLLNFIDGLWSSCGDERIIVFTTNHKEKLDPALLRPGRMDVHINLSYCTPCGFRTLASNYLDIKEHKLFPEIEELIMAVKVSPAEVAEQLMRNDESDHEYVFTMLIQFLKLKQSEEATKESVNSEEDQKKIEEAITL